MGNAGYGNHTSDGVDPARPGPQQAGRTPTSGKVSGKDKPGSDEDTPAAGPHAKPSLTNPDATPGTGALTPPGADKGTDSTTG